MTRILVTGANGQLGNEMRVLSTLRPQWEFIFTDVSQHPGGLPTEYLDITKPIAPRPVNFIVNCAAYTAVDAAEDNEQAAELLNATAAANLSQLALSQNATLIHISTDYVFDGSGTRPYRVTDRPCPVSAYGRTKLKGEELIARSGCRHIIIRTAWLYSEFGKNFVKTMLRLTAEKPSVSVVSDQVGSPTFALDLARAIFTIIERLGCDAAGCGAAGCGAVGCGAVGCGAAGCGSAGCGSGNFDAGKGGPLGGIYHFTGRGSCSWYEFASLIASLGGHPDVVHPCTSAEFPSKVHRPAYSVLDLSRLESDFGITPPLWQDSLRECLGNMGIDL